MNKKISLLLVTFLLFSPLLAEKGKIEFDETSALKMIKEMSGDSMQGRKSGQPGGVLGEEYVATKFREWGLEPAGDNGTYFQKFTIEHRNIQEGVAFEIITHKMRREFYYGDDWRVQRYSGSGHFTAELVFAGYGIHAPEKGYNDYENVEVKGKLVLITTGAPKKLEKKLDEEMEMKNRIKAAQEKGALGIIGFRSPSSQSRYFSLRAEKENYDPGFVLLSAEDEVMDLIFKNLKTELSYQFQQIDKLLKPQSFLTGIKAYVSVNAVFDPKRETRNVLAKITGKDEKLNKEYVIIGGHMDHLGVGPMGDIYNGANDNASGTAVVMEIARIMKMNGSQPKRTVIFAAWAGEEQGLLGSRHYADNPTHPMEKTVTYFNLDMVGHGNGVVPFRGEYYGPQIWETIKVKLSDEILDYVEPGRGGPGGSDHSPFLAKGVPAYAIMTKGHHFKYHHPRDDTDLIDPALLKRVGDFIHEAVRIVSNEPVDLIEPNRKEIYQLKYQNLINFNLNILNKAIEHRKDVKDSYVDVQLSVVEEDEALSGDELRIDVINKLLEANEKINKSKGLVAHSSSRSLYYAAREGKTTVIPGLRGLRSMEDNPQWAQVLASQGIYYVMVDEPHLLLNGDILSEKGEKLIKALNKNGILLILKQAENDQVRAVLEASKKPLFFITKSLPDKEMMDLLNQKESGIGLVLEQDSDLSGFLDMLEQAVKTMGFENIALVNEFCLWKDSGKNRMLEILSGIIQAEYERRDFSNLFSGTFFRLLQEVREGQ